jgi:hypothetical protein
MSSTIPVLNRSTNDPTFNAPPMLSCQSQLLSASLSATSVMYLPSETPAAQHKSIIALDAPLSSPASSSCSNCSPGPPAGLGSIIFEDIKARMSGPPSGAAKLANVYRVLKFAQASKFAGFFVDVPEARTLQQAYLRLMRNPAVYHVDAKMLVGLEKLEINRPGKALVEYVSCYVHAALKGTAISHARVFLSERHVSGNPMYKYIRSMLAQDGSEH